VEMAFLTVLTMSCASEGELGTWTSS